MALLHSLQISGVRSFSPESQETIMFNTPVTLFLGQNGCGKTTIIESIRFGLTGELPSGTNSGQGFINDPKMSNKNQTKASVKIKFYDCQGNLIRVSRFMSVTAKAGGQLTFKNLMFNIRKRDEQGVNQDISGRCVDINTYCCTSLNVSKSILNNVLFCHQENSAWPLDESKKLKEKFDEIFDATKYNKCVETLRKFIKEKQSNVKILKERLSHKKSLRENVEQQRTKLNKREDELHEVVEQINNKQKEIKPLNKRFNEILDIEDSLGTLQTDLTGKKAEKKGLQEQQLTIKTHIKYVFEGSEEELLNKIDSFKSEQSEAIKAIKELESKKMEITNKIGQLNKEMQKLHVHIGQLKEEQKQNKNKIEESEELIENLRIKLEIREFSDINDKETILEQLRNTLKKSEENYVNLVKQMDIEEKELQNKIDAIREKCAGTKEQVSSKTQMISECKNKIKDIRIKLDELDTSDSQLRIVGDRIEKIQNDLTRYKNSFNEDEKLQEMEELKEDIDRRDQYLEKLDREYRTLQQNFVTDQKLESEENTIIEKQGETNKIKSRHSHNLQKLFGDNIPQSNYKKNIIEIQNREDAKIKSLNNKITKLEREVTQVETTLRHERKKLEHDKKELSLKQRKVSELCKDRPFKDVLQESYNKREKLQKDKGQYRSAKVMYEAFINKFEKEQPCCPICQTDFSNKQKAVDKIINELRSKIQRIPADLVKVENDLKKEEDFYNKLQQLKTVNDEIESLSVAKIPLLENELTNLNEKYEDKQIELASEKSNLTTPQELVEACKNFVTDATLLDQYLTDIIKSNDSITVLKRNIIKVSSNRSRQETEALIDTEKAELSNKKNRYDSCKKNFDQHQKRCQQLNADIQRETQKQIDIQKLVQQKPLLETQYTEYNDKMENLKVETEQLNDTLITQNKEKTTLEEEKQTLVQTNRKIKDNEKHKIDSNKSIFNEILKLQNNIKQYIRNDTDGKLNDACQKLTELKIDESKLDQGTNKISDYITQKRESLATQENEFSTLKYNVTLREKEKLEKELSKAIQELEKNIGDYNYRTVHEEKVTIEKQLDKRNREINSLEGQQEEIQKQVRELEKELEKPENKNAYNNYKKQFYELKVEQLAIEDLSNYVNVLERSILKFHEERMVQINRTIRELWRSIYRGNDIDYIEIKTDENMMGGVNRRRTYNYKVVQVKNNVELEMRGRCSAGQKVLACLVIRMALAETFSAHCGILALDEPTTNLDRDNISSLSDSLARIIAARENEKNFQLLIITHDEEFLASLTRVNSLDSYWKVKRNQGGFSTVEKQFHGV